MSYTNFKWKCICELYVWVFYKYVFIPFRYTQGWLFRAQLAKTNIYGTTVTLPRKPPIVLRVFWRARKLPGQIPMAFWFWGSFTTLDTTEDSERPKINNQLLIKNHYPWLYPIREIREKGGGNRRKKYCRSRETRTQKNLHEKGHICILIKINSSIFHTKLVSQSQRIGTSNYV